MAAYLLPWNPNRWKWNELSDVVAAFQNGEAPIQRWSCGTVKRIDVGDRVFLIRLVEEPKGIFGYGTILTASYRDTHWEDASRTSQYVKFQIDGIVHPEVGPIIPRDRLDSPQFSQMHWNTQMSGVRIPDDVAAALLIEWARLVSGESFTLPEEIDATSTYAEGATRVVTVNSYERNPRARHACISHYGTRCAVCGFHFGEAYGSVGEGLIHVHHLTLLSEKGESYDLDAIKDLRPVCPNCHAIIHQRVPPFSVDEVKAMLRNRRG